MLRYKIEEINKSVEESPEEFIKSCEEVYNKRLSHCADLIVQNIEKCPIVLISGPSGSGKTTTSLKIEEVLNSRGIRTHALAMDNYFRDHGDDYPKLADGSFDLESPKCVDMELLREHFKMLMEGKSIAVPHYDFALGARAKEPSKIINMGKNHVVVVEGIHAFSDDITDYFPDALKLYISARSNVYEGEELIFKGTWMRLIRRIVRDNNFRGYNAANTMKVWANVRKGEKNHISPFKDKAAFKFDSSFPYEVCVLKYYAKELLKEIPDGIERYEQIKSILPAFDKFAAIDPNLVPKNSMLREFIGGGIY